MVISIDGGVLAVKKDSISVSCYDVEWNWEGKGTGEEIWRLIESTLEKQKKTKQLKKQKKCKMGMVDTCNE